MPTGFWGKNIGQKWEELGYQRGNTVKNVIQQHNEGAAMMWIAAARTQSMPEGGTIIYEIVDAEALRFKDGAFDGVTSTFGIMFASRW